jgi:hypothetical protein
MSFTLPMSVIYWFFGFLMGISFAIIFSYLKNKYLKTAGVIEVDIQSNLCRFHITSMELSNLKTKKVIFRVVHNVNLSREEQRL